MTEPANQIALGDMLKPRRPVRLALAVGLAAPIAGAVVAIVLGLTVLTDLVFMFEDPQQDSVFVKAGPMEVAANLAFLAFTGFSLGAIIGWPFTLAVALPAHAWLVHRTSAKVYWYAVLGLGAGLAAAAAYLASLGGGPGTAFFFLTAGSSAGVLAGVLFWAIRRPDRDAAIRA
jgi:hypothetical protein